MKYVFRLDTNY